MSELGGNQGIPFFRDQETAGVLFRGKAYCGTHGHMALGERDMRTVHGVEIDGSARLGAVGRRLVRKPLCGA